MSKSHHRCQVSLRGKRGGLRRLNHKGLCNESCATVWLLIIVNTQRHIHYRVKPMEQKLLLNHSKLEVYVLTLEKSNWLDRLGFSRVPSTVFLSSSFMVLNKSYQKKALPLRKLNNQPRFRITYVLCKDERILPQRVEITIGQIAPTACSPHNPVNSI